MRPSFLRVRIVCVALAVAFLGGAAATCRAQTRLYLKDGTYLMVKGFEIKGDRVRYYSIADEQWEEMPLSLVDLAATRRAEAEKAAERRHVLKEAEKTARPTYQLPPNTGYQIAPGIRLPSEEGLYAYDGIRLIHMITTHGSLVRDKKRLALVMVAPDPFLKQRYDAIVPGKAAAIRILSSHPVFYAQFAGGGHLALLRLKAGKENREIEKVEQGHRHHGAVKVSSHMLPLEVSEIHPGLFKIQPSQALGPGEYALEEASAMPNLVIWDFGIDSPNAKPQRKPVRLPRP